MPWHSPDQDLHPIRVLPPRQRFQVNMRTHILSRISSYNTTSLKRLLLADLQLFLGRTGVSDQTMALQVDRKDTACRTWGLGRETV
jgi:hypothetical protein